MRKLFASVLVVLSSFSSRTSHAVVPPSSTINPDLQTAERSPDMSGSKVLKVSDFLSEKNICFFDSNASKQEILTGLISTLQVPNPEQALEAVLAREAAGSTMIAPGLMVPHARVAGLSRIRVAVGFVKTAASAGPNEPRIWMLFLGSSEKVPEHLAFLSGISALFQVEGLLNTLPQLPDAPKVLARIRAVEEAF